MRIETKSTLACCRESLRVLLKNHRYQKETREITPFSRICIVWGGGGVELQLIVERHGRNNTNRVVNLKNQDRRVGIQKEGHIVEKGGIGEPLGGDCLGSGALLT